MRAFVRRVEQQIERDGPMLPYSQRRRLLTEAQRQGIRRFDANLIIAAVQERAPESPSAETNEAGRSFLASAATVLLVQSAILAGAALIYFS